jgi:L-methionine (R)-S-oxide reductase
MADNLNIDGALSKAEKYKSLLAQTSALLAGEKDGIAAMANMAAVLRQGFSFLWVGFYRVDGDNLILGPFQGDVACLRIAKGKGVCGTAWAEGKTIIVPNVDEFPGHIACSASSKSEIVVPVFKDGVVVAVLDVDSDQLNYFDKNDQEGLEKFAQLLANNQ